MEARIRWLGGAGFVGETGSGHAVVMDGPADFGGRNIGPRPMEMLLLGTGACSAFDVVTILRKVCAAVADCDVHVEADRSENDPRVFTRIHLRYVVRGRGLERAKVERAVKLSAEKYCSASIMLGRTARMEHTVEIVDTDSEPVASRYPSRTAP